jgi:AcrR family transcriptional regulator
MSGGGFVPMDRRDRDQRVRRTRDWILKSFSQLVRHRPYQSIHVLDIIGVAGVGRSTFYEHFRGKDEVFRHALTTVLSTLADAVTDAADVARVQCTLEHFWENRKMARGMLRNESASQVAIRHAELFEERLSGLCSQRDVTLIIPLRLAATQLAAAQLGLITAWLDGVERCTTAALAQAIHQSTRSAVAALIARDA